MFADDAKSDGSESQMLTNRKYKKHLGKDSRIVTNGEMQDMQQEIRQLLLQQLKQTQQTQQTQQIQQIHPPQQQNTADQLAQIQRNFRYCVIINICMLISLLFYVFLLSNINSNLTTTIHNINSTFLNVGRLDHDAQNVLASELKHDRDESKKERNKLRNDISQLQIYRNELKSEINELMNDIKQFKQFKEKQECILIELEKAKQKKLSQNYFSCLLGWNDDEYQSQYIAAQDRCTKQVLL